MRYKWLIFVTVLYVIASSRKMDLIPCEIPPQLLLPNIYYLSHQDHLSRHKTTVRLPLAPV